jgi:gliding motility-associated lipoprotein GldD
MKSLFFLILVVVLIPGCKQDYQPKPYGYFRIDLPDHSYHLLSKGYAYSFEVPDYAQIQNRKEKNWINIHFPEFKAQIHLTYKPINGNLIEYIEESRSLAFNHTQKADGIKETVYHNDAEGVHGLMYEIEGSAASSIQFYLTDSVRHFLRGALYFRAIPNPDSLAPVNAFITEDIRHLMETTRWNDGTLSADK